MGRARVLLADDHTMVMEALGKLLEPEFEIAGMVSDGATLLSFAAQARPDAVVLDLAMPVVNGMDAGKQLRDIIPQTRLVVLTMVEDVEVARKVMKEWASGYLLKSSAASELTQTVRLALRGESYVTPKMQEKLFDRFIGNPHVDRARTLTPRQREILELLAEGRTVKETAATLHVAERTVVFHKCNIMENFGLKTSSELVKFALEEGMIAS